MLQRFREQKESHPVFSQFKVQNTKIVKVVLRVRLLALLVHLVKFGSLVCFANVETRLVDLVGRLFFRDCLTIAFFLDDEEGLSGLKLLVTYHLNLCFDVSQQS